MVLECICGVQPAGRNIMPVFYCAIIPAAVPHCARGRRDCGWTSVAASVYTLAHAGGFVTRSLYEARPRLPKLIEKEAATAFRDEERLRIEWRTLAPLLLIYVIRYYPETPLLKYLTLQFRILRKARSDIRYY